MLPQHLHALIQGSGPPLLCLHGHPGSGACMDVFTQPLSRHFQTIAPDLRGYGASKASASFTMIEHLQDLEALLDQLAIPQCLILGWSLGGILALELALRRPDQVQGLILVATAAHPRSDHPPITWQDNLYTGIAGILNWLKPGWPWNIQTWGTRSLFRYLFGQQTPLAYRYLARYGVEAYLQTSRHAQQALNQALRQGYNRTPDLQQIHCPCLVLAGAGDRHITAAASHETAQQLPHATWHCYPDTAHLFPWEIPDQVLTDIEHWLGQTAC
ncbi:MAG: alpha/beta hydrolase [Cyanobacteria bacterium P01_H01_bin.121]